MNNILIFDLLRKMYETNGIDKSQLEQAILKNWITQEQYSLIIRLEK